MGPHIETTESAAAPVLVLSEESALVPTTIRGLDPPPNGVTAIYLASATWGARCGKSARRVLRGGTGTRGIPRDLSLPTNRCGEMLIAQLILRRQICFDCTTRVHAIQRPSGDTFGCIKFPESRVNWRGTPPRLGIANNCKRPLANAL